MQTWLNPHHGCHTKSVEIFYTQSESCVDPAVGKSCDAMARHHPCRRQPRGRCRAAEPSSSLSPVSSKFEPSSFIDYTGLSILSGALESSLQMTRDASWFELPRPHHTSLLQPLSLPVTLLFLCLAAMLPKSVPSVSKAFLVLQ